MLVDFIIAELLIWAVMVVLFPPTVAIVGALTRRMSLPMPRPARRKRRTRIAPPDLRALSTMARRHRRSMPSTKVPLRP